MKAIAVIPARYASTRFPGKLLEKLNGKAVLQHVYENVCAAELFDRVCIACDDERIYDFAKSIGAEVFMTSPELPSGTDRVAAVIYDIGWEGIVVNVQGDEPLISKAPLSALLAAFEDETVQMASLMTVLEDFDDLDAPHIVKVVVAANDNALYFSRSPIPFDRDGNMLLPYYRHIGVYAFRHQCLQDFVSLPLGKLEQTEKLEQLRALEYGIPLRMVYTDYQGMGIDTPEDLARVKSLLNKG